MLNRLAVVDTERCTGCQSCMFACSRRMGSRGLMKTSIGVHSAGGMERGFVVIVCRACPDPPCARVCPENALKLLKGGGGVRLDVTKCSGCRLCQLACPIGCVFWDSDINKPSICVHCGYCVAYCPHEVLEMERTGDNHA